MGSTAGVLSRRIQQMLAAIGVLAVCTTVACTSQSSPAPTARSAASTSSPTITITPPAALIDEPVAVTINGLAPGAAVTVLTTASDRSHVRWTATAQFTATSTGTVSLGQPTSGGGSYSGTNAMGLFQSMSPTTPSATTFLTDLTGYAVQLQVSVAGEIVATATTQRLGTASANVRQTAETVSADGVHGILFLPKSSAAGKPAVVVLGGSEGGLAGAPLASVLADHGYPSLALAYFHEPDLPSTLTGIPLEYFVKGIRLLDSQPGVDAGKLMVFGVSRGSEAALLLGAHFPALVHGVIAGSPSMVAFGDFPSTGAPAWTLDGKPLPFGSATDFTGGDPEPTDVPAAIIPVEKINGPILTICGTLDMVWHSCRYSDGITARLKAQGVTTTPTALTFPDGGHLVGSALAYTPLTDAQLNGSGGTVSGNALAMGTAHQQLLTWLSHQ